MMTLSGCSNTIVIDSDCLWLNPYPELTDEQYKLIHKAEPRMSTWARDYKIEYKENCE